jgi:hypothetical protein
MPRKPNRQVDSAKVQGEGTYVVFRRLLWGEFQELSRRQEAKEITGEQYSSELIARQLADWNWTDESGVTLPVPQTDPSVLERLTDEEVGWLIDQVNGERQAAAAASKSG